MQNTHYFRRLLLAQKRLPLLSSFNCTMSYMGKGRHLAPGDAEPDPPAKDVLRVYGMKFCPYVQRLKLVMHAKSVDHENVNCNLMTKPDWLFVKNPRGKVPVLEINGKILYESDVTSRYIDEAYTGDRKLVSQDLWRRAEEQILLGDLNQSISGFYGAGLAKDEDKRKESLEKIKLGFSSLEKHLKNYSEPFIGGKKAGFSDYMFWPFLERISLMMMPIIQQYPSVLNYYEHMSKDPSVIACRQPDDIHMQFIKSYQAKNLIYDIGDVDPSSVTLCSSKL